MVKAVIKKIADKMGLEVNFRKNLWYKDSWKVKEKLLAGNQRPVIFDVGACDGGTVKKYKQLFPQSAVHAFEPQPLPYKHLTSLGSIYKDLHFNNLALSDHKGQAEFTITEGYASSSLLSAAHSGTFVDTHTVKKESIRVELTTLDEYVRSKGVKTIDLLKMDVQGNELNVLKGATELLKSNNIGIIYSEVWFTTAYEGQAYFEDIALFLRAYNYKIHGLYDVSIDFANNGQALWGDVIFVKR